MRRRQVLLRRVVAFSAAACVLLAVVILRPSRTVPPRTDFPATFEGFDPAAATSLRIARTTKREGKEVPHEVVLERTGASSWVLANRGRYPAKADQVGRFLDEMKSAKTKATNTTDRERAKTFAGEDGFTEVTIGGPSGTTLARFGIGKAVGGGSWDSYYVRLGEGAESPSGPPPAGGTRAGSPGSAVVTVEGLETNPRVDPEEWVDLDLWPAITASDLVEVEIDQRGKGRTIVLARDETPPPTDGEKEGETPAPPEKTADRWKVVKPAPGPASPSAASATASAFANLTLLAIVPPKEGATDVDYGFDKPTMVVTGRGRPIGKERPEYVLTVGSKVGGKDASYVRRGSEVFVFEVTQGALKEFESEPESWAEKKPEEKKPEAEKPGEGKPAEGGPPGGTPPEKPTEGTPPGAPPAEGPTPEAPKDPPAPGGTAPPAMGESPPPAPGAGETPPPR